VLILGGKLKWIDFRRSEAVTTKISWRRDVEILYKSLGGLVTAASMEILLSITEENSHVDEKKEVIIRLWDAIHYITYLRLRILLL
jgi:hypothetical protein